ncbi:hypothetical protein MSAN_00269600 [Mycena sanguinolenta]|uniref:G-protein coupled receptors family 2 profile 2 domain-containing protein n=1 Tax=Mycena sanguinolenta TaxID=230812 RepID=A0A8H6ZG95_9AGAR|nr:hypothetical protein MSAN_00269600 [Mycena sanguinolenta]
MSSSHEHLRAIIVDVTFGVAIPGVALSVLFLVAVAYLRWNPRSRPYLNRVSFRLLTYALVANATLGSLMFIKERKPGASCVFFAFVGVAGPMFSACMFCCIALNLSLVLVFGANGNEMEKYYIIGSVILCLACNIPPLAYGKLGWYAVNGTCWFRDPSPSGQLRWLVGAQSVWMVLMSTVEIISFILIVIFMIRHEATIQQLRADTLSRDATACMTLESNHPAHPIVRYRSMILRIGLYPIFSCFFSLTACGFGVYNVLHVQSLTDLSFILRILDVMITTLRPLLYALLAGTDPSLLRAIRSLHLKSSPSLSSPSQVAPPTFVPSSSCATDSPHSSSMWDNPIGMKQNAEARSRDNCSQPLAAEEEASQEEHDNVALQI